MTGLRVPTLCLAVLVILYVSGVCNGVHITNHGSAPRFNKQLDHKQNQRGAVSAKSLAVNLGDNKDSVGHHGTPHAHKLEADLAGSQTPRFFDQVVDHFAVDGNATFPQRFYFNDTYWNSANADKTKPVFLLVGGRSALTSKSDKIARVLELASSYGALVLALEHRYFGLSVPVDELTTEKLKFLTVAQALNDVANFIYKKQTALKLQNNPWILFGSSYAGSLAAWARLKYPHLVSGAYAASAPILAKENFFEFDQSVSKQAGVTCTKGIEEATVAIETMTARPPTKVSTKEMFTCETLPSNNDFYYAIAEVLSFGITTPSVNDPGRGERFCKDIVNATSSTQKVKVYAAFVKSVLKDINKACTDFDVSQYHDTTVDDSKTQRQIAWLDCTQVGWFQTAPSKNNIRSKWLTKQYHREEVCSELFGAAGTPLVDVINMEYGGKEFAGSQVVFTNSVNDPWSALSVTTKDSLASDLNYVVLNNDTAHAADLQTPLGTLRPSVLTKMRSKGEDSLKMVVEFQPQALTASSAQKQEHTSKGYSLKMVVIIAICCGIGCLVLSLVIALLYFKPRDNDEEDGEVGASLYTDDYGSADGQR
eukprot:GFYU01010112.1.p1 GENE.GFYU01010112.1~~GFYU01010112.1.p1  ORF type:complete len:594 (-),score=162.79 GFYU01010112.1:610-2391(-)